MTTILSDHDRTSLDERVDAFENSTNTQIILSVVRRCDAYSELPWKAFALGASVAALLFFILHLALYDWYPRITVIIALIGTLATGTLLALLTLIPGIGRRFLSVHRAEAEVKQYAESMFLQRELFATTNRTGILLLISLFERRIIILPDTGLEDRITEKDLRGVIALMAPLLKRKENRQAFMVGLDQLAYVLGSDESGDGENELPDDIIEEEGV
jgi:putative membrane protein